MFLACLRILLLLSLVCMRSFRILCRRKQIGDILKTRVFSSKVKKELEQLNELITRHDANYYVGYLDPPWPDLSPISDAEYDALVERAATIEAKNKKLAGTVEKLRTKVGSPVLSRKFEKYVHSKPMLSLENGFNAEEIKKFIERVESSLEKHQSTLIEEKEKDSADEALDSSLQYDYVLEPKIDGLSLALVYVNGNLTQAATRGDGQIGEDLLLVFVSFILSIYR